MKVTINNLMIGFISESETRTKYELYAEVARKENLLLISNTFYEFANQKREYSNRLYLMLQELKKDEIFNNIAVEIKSTTDIGSTFDNLKSAIKSEDDKWQDLYPDFINTAQIEGYLQVAEKLRKFAQQVRNQSQRLKMLLKLIESKTIFKEKAISFWKCMSCGYEVAVEDLAEDFVCSSCGHLKTYFQKKNLQITQEKNLVIQKPRTGWVCMECGYEVDIPELPDDWECSSCGRSKVYFKKKSLKQESYKISTLQSEIAHWKCLECGNEEEIELPIGWKCSKCGFPG